MTRAALTRNKSNEIILEVLAPILKSQPSSSAGFDLALFYFLTKGRKKKRKPSLQDPDYVRKIMRSLDMARIAARISQVRTVRLS